MNDGKSKRNRSVPEWGILPQAPWDLTLTGQDWQAARSRVAPDRAQSRRLRRRSGYVPVEPCLSLSFNQYMKVWK